MTHSQFEVYPGGFNAREYNGLLDYRADGLEMVRERRFLRSHEEVLTFYAFLHYHLVDEEFSKVEYHE